MGLLRSSFLTVSLVALQAVAQITSPDACATGVHVIAVRGHGTDNEPYGLSTSTISNITDALPGSDASPVEYKSGRNPVILASIIGARHAKRWIRRYVRSCPNTPIVLQGYSQGAIAVMTALCGGNYDGYRNVKPIEEEFHKNIIAAITYGDETRNADATYNAGTCTADSPHPKEPWECGDLTDRIKAWCDYDDPLCCIGGDNPAKHVEYAEIYNADAVAWIVEQLATWTNGTTPPPYYPPDENGPPPPSNGGGHDWSWWWDWIQHWWQTHNGSIGSE